ncbi:Crp/Fnr family transcriptional regulator [Pseudoruegeria sp. SHC-113]|uniref:Crp/Fnr family transcriptional regulator n=1 Tax=Pseudoruegeria sp. SHC-113 TaxID=2855439 RepID=UPI0021BB27A2|nr:Crp/Fnr family transcriptional regulator [Pseudoruegeria sp. SHC-113]
MHQPIGDWTERFDGTRGLPRDLRDRLLRLARVQRFRAGDTVFAPGRLPDSLLLLVEGRIRVSQTSDSGREIVLYRVEAGQSCVLTTACILAEEAYSAEGIAETDLVAIALARSAFDQLAADSPAFRSFVFAAYSKRLLDLLRVVDDVAFGKIDVRLAARLVALADTEGALKATHQQLATELGTAREVISRQLTEFQRRGWIEQSRGRIAVQDRAALEALAQQK